MPTIPTNALSSLSDVKKRAKVLTSKASWDWLQGGAEDAQTASYNEKIFEDYSIIPRILNPAPELIQSKEPFENETIIDNLLIAPMGGINQFREDAETILLEVAKELSIPVCLSGLSVMTIEEARNIAGELVIPSIYLYDGKEIYTKKINQYNELGIKKLVISVDCPYTPISYNKLDNWYDSRIYYNHNKSAMRTTSCLRHFPTWDDIAYVKNIFNGQLILKGIQSTEDISKSLDLGLNTIWMSNHGGRAVNNTWHPIDLMEQFDVRNKYPTIHFITDGGIRKGSDALKCFALGSDSIALGRLIVYGIIVAGKDGLLFTLKTFMNEIQSAMLNSGAIFTNSRVTGCSIISRRKRQ